MGRGAGVWEWEGRSGGRDRQHGPGRPRHRWEEARVLPSVRVLPPDMGKAVGGGSGGRWSLHFELGCGAAGGRKLLAVPAQAAHLRGKESSMAGTHPQPPASSDQSPISSSPSCKLLPSQRQARCHLLPEAPASQSGPRAWLTARRGGVAVILLCARRTAQPSGCVGNRKCQLSPTASCPALRRFHILPTSQRVNRGRETSQAMRRAQGDTGNQWLRQDLNPVSPS